MAVDRTLERGSSRRKFILFGTLVFLLGMLCVGIDNGDVWFMDVHAKDMLANGLNGNAGQFTAYDGLTVPYQKWAMCLLVHVFMLLGGYHGMIAGSALFCGLFALCLYLGSDPKNHELRAASVAIGFTFLLSISGTSSLLSFRPHVIAACVCMGEIVLLERRFCGERLSRPVFLAGMAGCSIGTMWFHSTMWIVCLIPVFPYLAEGFLQWIRSGCSRDRFVLDGLMSLLVMILAGCLNPLGFGQFRYMWIVAKAGLGSDKYDVVGEMLSVQAIGLEAYAALWIAVCGIAVVVLFLSRAPVRHCLFFFGGFLMSVVSVRFMIYFYAFVLPLISMELDCVFDRLGLRRRVLPLAVIGLMVVSFLPLRAGFREMPYSDYAALQEAMDQVLHDVPGQPRVFIMPPHAASVSLTCGFLPAYDTRAEVYDGDLNGGYDILPAVNTFYHLMGSQDAWLYFRDELFDKYDLDVVIFQSDQLTADIIDGIQASDDLYTFVVQDRYVVCERVRQ